MRVISGSARGINLQAPSGMVTRPTSDRVREALFSIIQSRFELTGASILDLCAGTGALGIEALSRGACFACFVECNPDSLKCIKNNIAATKLADVSELLGMDVIKALVKLGSGTRKFDMIFFDPPYSSDLYSTVPEAVCSFSLINSDGLFVAESSVRNVLPERIGCLLKIDSRTYADTVLNFYVLEDV